MISRGNIVANNRTEIYFFNDCINIVQTIFFPSVLNSFVMEEGSCWTLFGNRGTKNVRHAGSIGTFGDAARPGQGREVTESKTVSCIGMPFIGFRWYNMNVFASGSDIADSTQFGGFWWVETERWDRFGFLSFSCGGTSSRGCVSGIMGVEEILNKRRHALNMCKR